MAFENVPQLDKYRAAERVQRVLQRIDECLAIVKSTDSSDKKVAYLQVAHGMAFSLQLQYPEIFGEPGKVNETWCSIFGINGPVGGWFVGETFS